ncbi:MAG: biotin-dependent carboxyltransferase family protein [Burkholderiales bacterium]
MTVKVLRPGALATLQDLGRRGLQHLAIVPGGAMDPVAHRVANALVGNRGDAATLEIAVSGPELLFERGALVALAGARFDAWIDGAAFPGARPALVRAGARLRIGRATAGAFAYLAVAGGFDVAPVLGSRSTYLPGHFGGLDGRLVAAGASLPLAAAADGLGRARFARAIRKRREVVLAGGAARSVGWFAPNLTVPTTEPAIGRAVEGVHAALFTDAARAAFYGERWRVAPDSNRMGYRLLGPKLELVTPTEIVSQATCLGTVQVPAGGQPIVLMVDHQTTGGYPKLAELIGADAPLIAQVPPGGAVRFVATKLDEADAARAALAQRAAELIERILWEFGDADA